MLYQSRDIITTLSDDAYCMSCLYNPSPDTGASPHPRVLPLQPNHRPVNENQISPHLSGSRCALRARRAPLISHRQRALPCKDSISIYTTRNRPQMGEYMYRVLTWPDISCRYFFFTIDQNQLQPVAMLPAASYNVTCERKQNNRELVLNLMEIPPPYQHQRHLSQAPRKYPADTMPSCYTRTLRKYLFQLLYLTTLPVANLNL